MKRRRPRAHRLMILGGILSIVVLIVTVQLWLLTATMNAQLGGDHRVALPAALVSLVCFCLVLGLLHFVYRLER